MTALISDLTRLGGAARRKTLIEVGHSYREQRLAIDQRQAVPVTRSWLVLPDALPTIFTALQCRGVVGGAAALETYGVWVTEVDQHVVAIKQGAHHDALPFGVQRISGLFDVDWAAPWRVSLLDALAQHCRRATRNDAIASIDSALHQSLLAPGDLNLLAAKLPIRCRSWLRRVDARAESGLETILRLACQDQGWKVDAQVPFRGGNLDLVINGWLCVETDGATYHDGESQARKDRRRNNQVAAAGMRWHRFSYADVVHNLDRSIDLLRTLLRQGRPLAA